MLDQGMRAAILKLKQQGHSIHCTSSARVAQKTIRGHRYYYLVRTSWVNGRSRYIKQQHLGKAGKAEGIAKRLHSGL